MEPDPDPLDIFELSLPTLFSQPILAHSLPSTSPHFLYPHPTLPDPIKLKLPADVPAGLNRLQAQYVWPSSLLLAHLVLSGEVDLTMDDGGAGARVCELGAGTGLAGVAAAITLSRRQSEEGRGGVVVATDWGDPSILATLLENYMLNLPVSSTSVQHVVLPHEWGTPVSSLLSAPSLAAPKRFDTLLLADLLYASEGHAPLLKSVRALLAPRGVAYVTAGLHGGRGAVDRFVGLVREDGGMELKDRGVWVWEAGEEEWREVQGEGEGRVWRAEVRWVGGEVAADRASSDS